MISSVFNLITLTADLNELKMIFNLCITMHDLMKCFLLISSFFKLF